MNSKTYPIYIAQALRHDAKLKYNDDSQDKELQKKTSKEIYRITKEYWDAALGCNIAVLIADLGGRIVWPEDEVRAEAAQETDDPLAYVDEPLICDGCGDSIAGNYTDYLAPHEPDCPNWRPTGDEDGEGFVDCNCNRVFHPECYDYTNDLTKEHDEMWESIREYSI